MRERWQKWIISLTGSILLSVAAVCIFSRFSLNSILTKIFITVLFFFFYDLVLVILELLQLNILLLFIIIILINSFSILDALELLEDLIVLLGAFLSRDELRATFEVKKVIGARDRGQPMGDHNDSQLLAGLGNLIDSVLHFNFTFWVQRARCLVEDQNFRALDQGTCDSDSLLLPA